MKTLTIDQVMAIHNQGEAAVDLALEWFHSDPRLEGQFRQLRQMAADAGVEDNALDRWGLSGAYSCHTQLEELLAAEGWKHPGEVLDPDGTEGLNGLEEMRRLAQARIDRGAPGEDRQRLELTAKKIAEAHAQQRELEKIAAELSKLPRGVARQLFQPFNQLRRDLWPDRRKSRR